MKNLVDTLISIKEIEDLSIENFVNLVNAYAELKAKPENQIPYRALLFDIVKFDEPHFSKIFKILLAWPDERKEYPFLRAFIEKCLPIGCHNLEIRKPHVTSEENHIDIRIEDELYDIIIENKIKGARFQRNQIARYLKLAKEKSRRRLIFVVIPERDIVNYLENIPVSVWRLPPDWYNANSARLCAVDNDATTCQCDNNQPCPWKDGMCIDYRSEWLPQVNSVHETIIDWLESSIELIPSKESPLLGMALQLISYLKHHFNISENDNLNMELKRYIIEKYFNGDQSLDDKINILKDEIKNVDEIRTQMNQILEDLTVEKKVEQLKHVLGECLEELGDNAPSFRIEGEKLADCPFVGFKMENGLYLGIEYGIKPYWAILNPEGFTEEQVHFAEELAAKSGLTPADDGNDRYRWQYVNSLEEALESLLTLLDYARKEGICFL